MTEVTRGEFDMLRQVAASNASRIDNVEATIAHRIDSLDQTGTRGVGVVQTQLTELAKDMAGLATRMDAHEQDHKTDAAERKTARRWLVTAVIAAFALLEGPLAYVIVHLR